MFKKSYFKIFGSIMGILVLLLVGTLSTIYISSYRQVYRKNLDMLSVYVEEYWEYGNPGESEYSEENRTLNDSESSGESGNLDDSESSGESENLDESESSGESEISDENKNSSKNDQFSVDEIYAHSKEKSEKTEKSENSDTSKISEEPGENETYLSAGFYSVAFSADGEVLSVDHGSKQQLSDESLVELCKKVKDANKTSGNMSSWIYCVSEKDDVTLVALMDNMLISSSITTLFKNTLLYGVIILVVMIIPAILLSIQIIRPLEENDRKQKQFISDASHELKTPVSVISTNAEILNREIGENRWLSNIQYENQQMGNLVKQLLDLARAENVVQSRKKLNLSQVVMGSVLPFEGVAFDKKLHLQSEIEEHIKIYGNAEQMGSLVSILLDNALEYSKKEGTVAVTLKKEHHAIILSVSNEGEPISKEEQEHLFERFYRADHAREHASGHCGLGLAIANAITLNHKGNILIECKDGYVIFTVKIPEN